MEQFLICKGREFQSLAVVRGVALPCLVLALTGADGPTLVPGFARVRPALREPCRDLKCLRARDVGGGGGVSRKGAWNLLTCSTPALPWNNWQSAGKRAYYYYY